MSAPIFNGVEWGTMLVAVEEIAETLEGAALELRGIIDSMWEKLGGAVAGARRTAPEPEPAGYFLPPASAEQMVALTTPSPGRPGFRRDAIGREWYSAAWLDGPKAVRP